MLAATTGKTAAAVSLPLGRLSASMMTASRQRRSTARTCSAGLPHGKNKRCCHPSWVHRRLRRVVPTVLDQALDWGTHDSSDWSKRESWCERCRLPAVTNQPAAQQSRLLRVWRHSSVCAVLFAQAKKAHERARIAHKRAQKLDKRTLAALEAREKARTLERSVQQIGTGK